MSDVEKHPEVTSPVSQNGSAQLEETTLEQSVEHTDLGRALYEKSLQYDEAQLQRDSIKVRRKLDWMVLPMMCTTYLISFLDKQT